MTQLKPIFEKKKEMGTFELTFRIYNLLKQRNYTIIDLHKKLSEENINLSIRTLYRKVTAIQEALNNTIEYLDVEVNDRNVNNYIIKATNTEAVKKNSEWLEYINSIIIFKNNFSIKKDSHLNELFLNNVHEGAPLKSLILSLLNENLDFYKVTNFGELVLTDKLKKNLFKFIYYYTQDCIVCINKYSVSVKNNSNLPDTSEPLFPLNIVYHRGNYNLLFYNDKKNLIYSIELDMIDTIMYVAPTKNKKINDALLQESNEYSFGYHPSFDSKNYNITLLFPENPGEHIINRFWHKSQRYQRLSSGYIEFYLTCKIDIELLGWIMTWMDNVKIIEPEILKEFFKNRLDSIQSLYLDDTLPINNG